MLDSGAFAFLYFQSFLAGITKVYQVLLIDTLLGDDVVFLGVGPLLRRGTVSTDHLSCFTYSQGDDFFVSINAHSVPPGKDPCSSYLLNPFWLTLQELPGG